MKVGVALPTYDLESGLPLSLHQVAGFARRSDHSAWVMVHHWLIRDGKRIGAHDPNVTLGYLAPLPPTSRSARWCWGTDSAPFNQLASVPSDN